MVDFQTLKIHELMRNTKNIRNISVIAHVDHGKSTLTDCLLIKAHIANKESNGGRYMDTRKDEKERGITIKSTAVSMSFKMKKDVLEAYASPEEFNNEEFLINLIDSPGHVDFSSEVTAALRVTDGALVVVDFVDGICVQTETVLRQAIDERIQPTLVLNKMDRAMLELQYPIEKLNEKIKRRIESFNAKLGTILGDRTYVRSLDPRLNEISFCSGLQGWGFTLSTFARFFLNYKKAHTFEKEKTFTRILWSFVHYCDFEDEFAPKYKIEKVKKGEKFPEGKITPFEMFVLRPIYKVKDWCYEGDVDSIVNYLKNFDVDFSSVDLTCGKGKKLFVKVFKTWLPAAECLLEQIILKLPNPHKSQSLRADHLYTGPVGDETHRAIKLCSADDNAPVTIYVSKMIPDGSNGFIAFGRIFSGNLKPNAKVYVQDPEYLPDPNNNKNPHVVTKSISKVCVMMGRGYSSIPDCPAGNIVGLVGVERFLKKTGTVTTVKNGYNIKTMKFSVSPVVKVAVTPKNPKDLPQFNRGLDDLAKSDPLCVVEYNPKGQATVACSGELHLETILYDLKGFCDGCKFNVEEPQVKYYEGFVGEVTSPKMSKSFNMHNRVYMTCERLDDEIVEKMDQLISKDPKERAAKFREVLNMDDDWIKKILFFAPEVDPTNIMVDQTKGIQYLNEVKDHIFEGFKRATKEGPILGETVRGARYNLTDLVLHADSIHRGANQMIHPVEDLVRGLLLSASPILYEPVFSCNITVPENFYSACDKVLKLRRGRAVGVDIENNMVTIQGFVPVSESFKINESLRDASRGMSTFSLVFSHYSVCPGSLEDKGSPMAKIVEKVRGYKKPTTKLDPKEYFDTI